MNHRLATHLTALAAVALLLFGASQAFAVGTAADTPISNTASVQFTIGGNTPPAVTSVPAVFRVDQKVRMVVTSNGNTSVVANVNNYALPFTVTNESNTAGGSDYFQLTTEAVGTDSFNMNNVRIYRDVNGDGALDGGDADITANPYVQISNAAPNNTARFLIVADTPNNATTQASGNTSQYHLIATAWAGNLAGDGALADDADGTNNAGTAEVVYADAAGSATVDTDAALDGKHSAVGTYTTLATLGITKTASNGTSGYYIPGDALTYTITVTNGDPANSATSVTIYDTIPANTTFVGGTLACAASGTGTAGNPELSNDNGGTWAAAPGGTITDVRCANGTVANGGGTATMTFNVTIQ